MITLVIDGLPVPWKAHGGYGRRSFNPRFKEREYVQWCIRSQLPNNTPIASAVWAEFTFHMPIPSGTSKIRKLQMLNGILRPAKRPDRGNLLKFYEDCLTGIVWVDDSQVVDGAVRKIFAEVPRTVIRVLPIAQYTLGHIPEAKHVVD